MPATLDQTCNHGTLASDAIVTSLQGVNKNYGNIRALRGIDFRVRAGKSAQPRRQDHCREIAARPHSTHFRKNAGFQRRPPNQENRMRTVAMLQVARVPEMLRV
jgi:hypothetical protein